MSLEVEVAAVAGTALRWALEKTLYLFALQRNGGAMEAEDAAELEVQIRRALMAYDGVLRDSKAVLGEK